MSAVCALLARSGVAGALEVAPTSTRVSRCRWTVTASALARATGLAQHPLG